MKTQAKALHQLTYGDVLFRRTICKNSINKKTIHTPCFFTNRTSDCDGKAVFIFRGFACSSNVMSTMFENYNGEYVVAAADGVPADL